VTHKGRVARPRHDQHREPWSAFAVQQPRASPSPLLPPELPRAGEGSWPVRAALRALGEGRQGHRQAARRRGTAESVPGRWLHARAWLPRPVLDAPPALARGRPGRRTRSSEPARSEAAVRGPGLCKTAPVALDVPDALHALAQWEAGRGAREADRDSAQDAAAAGAPASARRSVPRRAGARSGLEAAPTLSRRSAGTARTNSSGGEGAARASRRGARSGWMSCNARGSDLGAERKSLRHSHTGVISSN
jgi:hypothetical protein